LSSTGLTDRDVANARACTDRKGGGKSIEQGYCRTRRYGLYTLKLGNSLASAEPGEGPTIEIEGLC
jgi:hypothetical protein